MFPLSSFRPISTPSSGWRDAGSSKIIARRARSAARAWPRCGASSPASAASSAPCRRAALRQQIRRQVITQQRRYGVRKAARSFRFLLFPVAARRGTRRAAMGLAMMVGLVTLRPPGREPDAAADDARGQEIVTVQAGAQTGQLLTTSEVADREFIWTDTRLDPAGARGGDPGRPRRRRQPAGPGAADPLLGPGVPARRRLSRSCSATTWRRSSQQAAADPGMLGFEDAAGGACAWADGDDVVRSIWAASTPGHQCPGYVQKKSRLKPAQSEPAYFEPASAGFSFPA